MKFIRETRQILTILVLLFALMVFNVAIVLLDAEDNKNGGRSRVNGHTKGSRVLISRILQEAGK